MQESRFHFSHFTNYLLYAFLILVTCGSFGFASFLNNEIAKFLIAFILGGAITGFIFYLIYKKEKQTKTFYLFFIFLLSYVVSIIAIHIASLLNHVFWFATLYLLLAVFSFVWLIIKLLNDIKKDKIPNETYFTTTIFLPFLIAVMYTGLFLTIVIPKPISENDELRTRGQKIFNKIYTEIDEQLQVEGYNIVKLSYIGYNADNSSLQIGCFSTLNAYTYHIFTYNFIGTNTANEAFEKIEREAHFPSYTKMFYEVDENNSYVASTSEIFTSFEVKEHYSTNYIDGLQSMVSAIVTLKVNNQTTYGTFISNYEGTQIESSCIYEGLSNYVVGLI